MARVDLSSPLPPEEGRSEETDGTDTRNREINFFAGRQKSSFESAVVPPPFFFFFFFSLSRKNRSKSFLFLSFPSPSQLGPNFIRVMASGRPM